MLIVLLLYLLSLSMDTVFCILRHCRSTSVILNVLYNKIKFKLIGTVWTKLCSVAELINVWGKNSLVNLNLLSTANPMR